MEPLLTVDALGKSFHHRQVLRDVSFSASSGEIIYLAGRNGSGKTTLLKILSGLMRPEKGQASLNGLTMLTTDSRWRQYMVCLGHRPAMYPHFSAVENIRLHCRLRGASFEKSCFMEWMDRFGLAGREKDPIHIYSEGMLQRLGIVRIAMVDWRLALLDEPVSALDQDGTIALAAVMEEWRGEGRTVVLTSHDLEWGIAQARRGLILADGVIKSDLNNPNVGQILKGMDGGSSA